MLYHTNNIHDLWVLCTFLCIAAELVDEHKVHPGLFDTRIARVKKADKALQQYNNSKPANIISNKKRELLKSLGYEVGVFYLFSDVVVNHLVHCRTKTDFGLFVQLFFSTGNSCFAPITS